MAKLLLVALLFLPLSTANADPPSDQDQIKALQEENQRLRAELAQLRLELSQLKQQLKQEADGQEDPGAKAKDGPKEQGPADEEKDQVRVFSSADEIYRSLPQELSPGKNGWDVPEKNKVKAWLTENIVGQQFNGRREIKSTIVTHHALHGYWEVKIRLVNRPMRYMNWGMDERLNIIVLTGDEAFAKQAQKKYKEGRRVQVSGEIVKINWDLIGAHRLGTQWHPNYCGIALSNVEVK